MRSRIRRNGVPDATKGEWRHGPGRNRGKEEMLREVGGRLMEEVYGIEV